MKKFEKFKSMDIDTLTEWLDQNIEFDSSPWMKWFDELYCKNCESIIYHYPDSKYEFPCSWCEINNKRRFFPEMDEAPDNKEIIKMWLESEVKE